MRIQDDGAVRVRRAAWTLGGRVRHAWFHFLGSGAYHHVHHSSAHVHRLANIGGGPFMLWDRVFGTYHAPPPERPRMGLTGRPPISLNPLRLAFASFLELAEELRLNRGWGERLRILLGPAGYQPPRRAVYLLRPSGGVPPPG